MREYFKHKPLFEMLPHLMKWLLKFALVWYIRSEYHASKIIECQQFMIAP